MNTRAYLSSMSRGFVLLLCLSGFFLAQTVQASPERMVYAVVTELTGTATAISPDGETRTLSVGSRLYVFDRVTTGADSKLVAVGEGREIMLASNVTKTLLPRHIETALQPLVKQQASAPDKTSKVKTAQTSKTSDKTSEKVQVPVKPKTPLPVSVTDKASAPNKATEPNKMSHSEFSAFESHDFYSGNFDLSGSDMAVPAAGYSSGNDTLAGPPSSSGGHLFSAREFLFTGQTEAAGYPLYSYLLFNREDMEGSAYLRRVAAIEGYLEQLAPVAEVRDQVSQDDINIFYMPVKPFLADVSPVLHEAYVMSLSRNEIASYILENYDFSQARVLMYRAGLEGDGPFIITIDRPLLAEEIKAGERIITQDLSPVPPELVKLWIEHFKYESTRWRTDENTSLRKLALQLRTEITVLAEAFRITNEAVASMIKEKDASE